MQAPSFRRALTAALVLACAGAVGAAGDPPPQAVLDAAFAGARRTEPLSSLAELAPLEPGQDFRVVEVARDSATSHHVVSIRDAEVPHRHDRHDLLVVLLKGYGTMRLGDERRAVGEGSILYVPRGTLHAFDNASPEPAVAYAVYLPAFDGVDRVVAGE